MVRHDKYLGMLLAFSTLLVAAACGDNTLTPTRPVPQAPNSTIFDGAHSGNKNVFFLPPIVANPVNQPGYGGTPQSGLPVTYRIVCVACGNNGANTLVTTLTPTFATDHYQANWDTKAVALDTSKTYRIEVRVGSQALAFADVDVVGSGSQLKKVDTQDFIALLDGRTLPINVRIQQGVTFCTSVNCASEIVPATTPVDQPFIVETADGLNGAAFRGQWNTAGVPAIVTIQDITSQVSDGTGCNLGLALVKLTIEHCVRISTDPAVIVNEDPNVDAINQNTVVVNTCVANPGDVRQALLKYDVTEAPIFLRDAPPPIACPPGYASINPSRNPFVRLASSIGGFLSDVFGPKTAYAIDLGAGGALDSGSGFSVFGIGFPASLTKVAGDSQTTTASTAVPIDPEVQLLAAHVHSSIEVAADVNPAAVANATITCTIISGGGTINGSPTSTTVSTNANGFATCPQWVLGSGVNKLMVTATGFGPDLFSLGNGVTALQLTNTYTFVATGTTVVIE
jgi:hypothetical protein